MDSNSCCRLNYWYRPMLIYTLISYLHLIRLVKTAVLLRDNTLTNVAQTTIIKLKFVVEGDI